MIPRTLSQAEALLVLSVLAREIERLEAQNQILAQQVLSLQEQLHDPQGESNGETQD